MSQEIEQIEARLTAYIDGQLPEKDRGEIEAYLASNPTHARLITELQRQRAQLRTLPREPVPVEIMDHLQAHLERHALLSDGDTSASMKINRWPQLGAVAAMLILAVGLGVLVYQVLPSGGAKPEQMVLAPPSVQQLPQVPALSSNEVDTLDKDKELNGASSTLPAPMMASPKRFDRMLNQQAGGRVQDDVEKMADQMAMAKASQTPTTLPTGSLNNSSAIVVTSDDPAMTRSLLATYLAENGMAFEVAKGDLVASEPSVPTTEPAGAMSVASVVQQLQFRNALPTTRSSASPTTQPENLIVVRNLRSEQVADLRQMIESQRDGRQDAKLVATSVIPSHTIDPKGKVEALKRQTTFESDDSPSATNDPTIAPSEEERMRKESTQPWKLASAEISSGSAPGLRTSTTQDNLSDTASGYKTETALPQNGDVLVVILAKPQASGVSDAATTMPSTAPAPIPAPVLVPMMPPTTAPATQPMR